MLSSQLTIITPAFNESDNLPLLYERLQLVLTPLNISWEWIVIDDHSRDATFDVVSLIAKSDARVRAFRFARNFGSHTAISCGLEHAMGECAVILAADLQDPPETIPLLMEKWRTGAQVVWAVRQSMTANKGFAAIYYFMMRHIIGMKEMPSTGADFFLLDQQVIKTLRLFNEGNVSLLALITWMGFRQTFIQYDKQVRQYGRSGWNLEKKLKLVIDSVASFTYLPVRLMSYAGFVIAALGFLYAGLVIFNGLSGRTPEGWAALMVVVLVIGGMQMLMMGVLGEYVWRVLDEARRRPRYWIELSTLQNEHLYNNADSITNVGKR